MGESEFNVIVSLRVTDLMLWCGLANTASREAERACVNTASTGFIGNELVDPSRFLIL